MASATVLSPAPMVSPGGSLNASAALGSFPNGSYTLTFYVVENASDTQLSTAATIDFDV
jgi:hypothetical protein